MVTVSYLGIGTHTGFVMRPACNGLSAEGYDIALHCADSYVLDGELDKLSVFLGNVKESDILFIDVHGDVTSFRHFGNLKSAVETSKVSVLLFGCEEPVVLQYRGWFRGNDEDYVYLRTLETVGGNENHRAALLWVMKNCGVIDTEPPPVSKPLPDGIYVPGEGGKTLEEGLADTGSTGKPVIGIFFANTYYTRGNLDAVDALYRSVEKAGAEPLALFFRTFPDELTGSIGISAVVDGYLIKNGKPIVDCILYATGFSATVMSQPGSGEQTVRDNFFARLNVPVIQCPALSGSRKSWEDSPFGLNAAELAYSVISPEFDGQIDAPPFASSEKTADGDFRQTPIPDRCDALAEMAYRWAMLRRIPESKKKVAVLIYMYPPRQDLAGGGYGLDSLQSVVGLLHRMKDLGYGLDWLPEDRGDLAARLLNGVTNDDNWKSDAQLREASVDTVSKELYAEWFGTVAESARKRFVEGWGEPVGDVHTADGRILLPGILNGNVFVGFQPDRGKCTPDAVHDPWTAPPHSYLGFYGWLKNVWGADAVVHMGTHGTLEWLPGKSVALSEECDPDIVLGKIPNINPYIIDNPGEGMQSKRRQYAVTVTHMIPSMGRAGGYGELEELESLVQTYLRTKDAEDVSKTVSVTEEIIRLCVKTNLVSDLGLSSDCTVEEMDAKIDGLYDYLLETKDTLIKDGLHVLGEVPEGERLCETLYSLVRYPNGEVPSLRDAVARTHGCDTEELLKNPSGTGPDGCLNGELLDIIDSESYGLILESYGFSFDPEKTRNYVSEKYPNAGDDLFEAVDFMCGFLIGAVRSTTDETANVLRALDGEYVPPGPSGCPGRGRAQILPTGRNFYSLDPDGIPWHSSWDIGSEMAEAMVGRYLEDNGSYPDTVGVVLWATDTMKTGGDDVAYVLKLMGLRPVWTGYGGRVKDLEVISLEELKRPRIDVVIRISGLFRDTFPNLSDLLDRGVRMISGLDEDDENNRLAANVRRDVAEAIASGLPEDEARREAGYRIFGDPPGEYGCGISDAVQTGNWKTVNDLAEIYVRHGCSVYGKGLRGEKKPDMFRRRLEKTDVTVKNHNSRAVDMLDMDDDFDSLGGFTAAVTAIRGKKPVSYMGDSSDMRNPRLRTAEEECRFVFRSKINNPKWLEGLKKHGFSGAKELSKLFDHVMGWSATSDIIENWMYDGLVENFVLDRETREWVKDENPYAMMAMLARLQEAVNRGFWKTDGTVAERLKDVYMDFEERIEEITDR